MLCYTPYTGPNERKTNMFRLTMIFLAVLPVVAGMLYLFATIAGQF